MKTTHKLFSATLLAAVGVAVAAPNATKAVEQQNQGTADIEFTKNTSGDTGITDPTGTRSEDTGISITTVDEFGILAVTPLDFKSHAATLGAQTYDAAAHIANKGQADEYSVENYVAIKDLRSTTDHTYKLSAELTKQFTATVDGTAVKLDGATLTYKNINVAATRNPGLQPADDKKVFGLGGSGVTEISETSGSLLVYQNTDANGGKGYYEVTFGDDAKGTEANSVTLAFGDDVDVRTAAYNATVTWTLTDAK